MPSSGRLIVPAALVKSCLNLEKNWLCFLARKIKVVRNDCLVAAGSRLALKLLRLHAFCPVSLITLDLFSHLPQGFHTWQGICCEVWVQWRAFCVSLSVVTQLLFLAMCSHQRRVPQRCHACECLEPTRCLGLRQLQSQVNWLKYCK